MTRPSGKGTGKGAGKGSGKGSGKGPVTGKPSGRSLRSSGVRSAGPGAPPRGKPAGRPSSSQGSGGRVGQRTGTPSGAAGGAKGLGGKQVEGRQAVRELLMGERRKIHEIWISAELEGDDGVADIAEIATARRVPLRYVAKGKLEHEARTDAPQGVLALAAEIPEADLGDLIRGTPKTKPFLVAVDGVTDPGNLGAIIRSCDAAGVTGLLLPRHRSVHITPTVSKASAGAIEYVPMALVPGLPTTLKQLKDHGVWTVGLDDDADQDIYEIGKLATDPICLVLGAEGTGISRLTRERCDTVVSIPMLGRVSSLNVAAAAAVSLFEVTRARRSG
jgi:23S rRNA (guanosine2251-2'-O)-methyltransferase